jgi:hypothetical protein
VRPPTLILIAINDTAGPSSAYLYPEPAAVDFDLSPFSHQSMSRVGGLSPPDCFEMISSAFPAFAGTITWCRFGETVLLPSFGPAAACGNGSGYSIELAGALMELVGERYLGRRWVPICRLSYVAHHRGRPV